MDEITKLKIREIIDDFAKEISHRKELGPKPAKTVMEKLANIPKYEVIQNLQI